MFGTYAGMDDVWSSSEDGQVYDGVRRHGAYGAAGRTESHWIVEADVAIAAATEARGDFGVEGYDTRWRVDGTQIAYTTAASGVMTLVERDDQGRYVLPLSEFPDVTDQVRRGIVDRVIGPDGRDVSGVDYYDDLPPETWSPEPVRGLEHELKTPPVCETFDAPDQAHDPARPF
ncbi:hypothetical protein BSP109_02200 [Brevibacterium sp. Mu109]|uniref:hypothetical protein n=1 Tax=Brevibacterium sp. Mu109 TaxID=1255669 RepID=UPI000C3BCA22|nr:hypothetical protein [Brevibacterium sp. Mu109]SMX87308.1 hypothetical protein BSP109_02200 [Brevibacterium sp. Mu109]